ncbi:MAG TPA: serine/threonine-protein kinase [Phycisphaerae bacterium]|nr:serine/threonine protein kinase [Phycisphaerae bacterium]HOB75979.1 serine/threonine-protein kinase [Phycisphaerae bacterium]HOJ55852.1 serine/threonine-protein kinase [Phycisphaerae bacterium]HOL27825.1 serine/threonine-protein kinase [Phycisphaerae bacterium]HPP22246.1 serine/threonine-protein kinase [Phycisphaerae bacterium]
MSFTVPGYTVYERLGTGARSTIWLVVDQRTGEQYALKRVVRRAVDDDRYIVQAQNDFEISSRLNHPSLRRSIDMRKVRKFFQVRELHIIMEYVDGRTLEQIGPLGTHGLLRIFIQVAHGLDALHRMGYVHTDIKPNNIMITATGQVKIIDFGQSCPVGHVKGRIQGTPDYIAPEQVEKGAPLDQRTDVFNLGATLYWAVTGRVIPTVLPSKKRRTGIDLVGPREAPLAHEVNPNVPTALSRLIADCCQPLPKDRPTDMREVLCRLEVAQHVLDKNDATLTGPLLGDKDNRTPARTGSSQ